MGSRTSQFVKSATCKSSNNCAELKESWKILKNLKVKEEKICLSEVQHRSKTLYEF